MWPFKRRRDDDFRRETDAHVAIETDRLIAEGMNPDEARYAAARMFGNVTAAQERFYESRRMLWLDELWRDARYTLRTLGRSPGFAITAVLTLALGIGANTAIFSVVNGVLLRPLPYPDAERIMTLWQKDTKSGEKEPGASPANFLDWRSQNQAFSAVAAAEPYSHNLSGQGEPEAFRSWLVTAGFFQILGVDALLGRTFTSDEYQTGRAPAVVISYGLWRRRFGGDPHVIGQTLRLNGQPHVVVGIMPPEFQFPPGRELWAPRPERQQDRQIRGSGYMPVIARLKPGTPVAHARNDMDAIAARLAREYPQANRDRGVTVVPLPEQMVGHLRPALLVFLGAVGFVLLIACSNVANLLLVRASQRSREFAIRSALGAGRARLARQWLTESVVLAVSGGVSGIFLAHWVLNTILTLGPGNLPRVDEIVIDRNVVAFVSAVSLLTAVICGLAPALFYRPDVNESLKEGGHSTTGVSRQRLRQVLVASEIALALILMIGAGLLIRSFAHLLQVNPGFTPANVVALEVHVWGWSRTPDQQAAFFEQTLDRIAALPGVQAAGAVSALPFHDNPISPSVAFTIEGRPVPLPGQEPTAFLTTATADYFRALGIPLRRGRFYTRFDRKDAPPVALINETLAARYWPDADPLGRTITARLFGRPIRVEIVGIVGDVRHTGLDRDPRPELFLPHLQSPYGSMTYVVRTAVEPLAILPAVKQEIWAINRNLPFSSVATMEEMLSRSFGSMRFNLLLLGSFAGIALMLAAIGIYGLIGFSIRQRQHEFGVRMALGESAAGILGMIISEGMRLTLTGVAIGLAGAFALTRFLRRLLFGVEAMDPLTFAAVAVLVLAVALLASCVAARRATAVDPLTALRSA